MSVLSQSTRIAIIGGGKMGEAIMGGWIAAQGGAAAPLVASCFSVVNPGEERRTYLHDTYGVSCTVCSCDVASPDVVVLAVKPQVMMGVLQELSQLPAYAGTQKGPLFISVAAGLTTERLESALPAGARLVRVMPNTPLLVGAGATAVTAGAQASADDVELVRDLFACLGSACVVSEQEMDAIGAVSGSGPAYVAAFIESLRDAGVAQGLSLELSESLAYETVYGTVLLMKETGQTAETVRINVCSPKGSTLAGLEAMGDAGFAESLKAGVAAAVRRSKELGQC